MFGIDPTNRIESLSASLLLVIIVYLVKVENMSIKVRIISICQMILFCRGTEIGFPEDYGAREVDVICIVLYLYMFVCE